MNVALVLAGGKGSRLGGGVPKQYLEIDGQMIITYCLNTFCDSNIIDAVWIVADELWKVEITRDLKAHTNDYTKLRGFSNPGVNRQLSILNGLEDIVAFIEQNKKEINVDDVAVMIHDAARPCLTQELISQCFGALNGCDGVMPVLPMKDTVYFSEDGKTISKLVSRNKIYAGQAPEVFRLGLYHKACIDLLPDKIMKVNGSSEVAIMAGLNVAMIPGDERNFKITTRQDLARFVGGNKI